jgi:hypothetical protein
MFNKTHAMKTAGYGESSYPNPTRYSRVMVFSGNEKQVDKAIRASRIPRNEIYITTKLR